MAPAGNYTIQIFAANLLDARVSAILFAEFARNFPVALPVPV